MVFEPSGATDGGGPAVVMMVMMIITRNGNASNANGKLVQMTYVQAGSNICATAGWARAAKR